MLCFLRFQVYGNNVLLFIAQPWIRGATAELQSYGNELSKTSKKKKKEELENQSVFENTLYWMLTHALRLSDPRFYLWFHFQNCFPEREVGQHTPFARGAENCY